MKLRQGREGGMEGCGKFTERVLMTINHGDDTGNGAGRHWEQRRSDRDEEKQRSGSQPDQNMRRWLRSWIKEASRSRPGAGEEVRDKSKNAMKVVLLVVEDGKKGLTMLCLELLDSLVSEERKKKI